MNNDPFFNTKSEDEEDSIQTRTALTEAGFFLCSFDNLNGLLVLFTVPSYLKNDQNEVNILKTHCIWRMDDIPIRIDLKITDNVYAAFLLGGSTQLDYINPNQRIYAVVIKLSKDQKIENKSFLDLKEQIEQIIIPNVELLHNREKYSSNPLKRKLLTENATKIKKVEKQLEETWNAFKFNLTQFDRNIAIITPLKETIEEKLPDMSKYSTPLYKQKISLRTFSTNDDPDQIHVILVNEKNIDLKDVLIHVSKHSEFFSETVWEQKLDLWPQKEDIILDFTQSDEPQNYLIKISSRKTTVAIKSLKIDPMLKK